MTKEKDTATLWVDPPTERVDVCPLCVGSQVNSDVEYAALLGLIPPYDVKACARCGMRWMSPRPTVEATKSLYTDENYFGGDQSPEYYADLANARRRCFRNRIRTAEVLLQAKGRLRVLDVGAATGEFLHEARSCGHEIEGVELSADARRAAQRAFGIILSDRQIEDIEGHDRYDFIHMNHVLEHLPNPVSALTRIRELLRPRGLLIVEVPQQLDNDRDRLKRALGRSAKPKFDAYSLHHLFFFTPRSLVALMQKCGLEVERSTTVNRDTLPLVPLSFKNLFLRAMLVCSDVIHRGGDIIEIHARKPA